MDSATALAGFASGGDAAAALVPLAVLAGVGLWIWWAARRARAMTFEVEPHGLRITAPLYGRLIPRTTLRIDEARIVNLRDGDLRPSIRTNGLGLPGVRIGWFRLRNGAKALMYIYKTDEALSVPTTEGHLLMLGSIKASLSELLASLKR